MSSFDRNSVRTLGFCLVIAAVSGCFDAFTLPACDVPADCPGGYVACDSGYCLRSSARCNSAGPVTGDGCCFVREGERAADHDCQGFAIDLEGTGFAGPALDGVDGAAYVATLGAAEPPDTGAWVWLTRTGRDGQVQWRVPVGQGSPGSLGAPMAFDDGVWVGFDAGLRGFDRTGAERDVVADVAEPGHVAVDAGGRLAWWSASRSTLVVRGATHGSLEHAATLEADGEGLAGPVFVTGGAHVVMAAGKRLAKVDATLARASGQAALSDAARDLAVSAGRLYVLEGAQRVSAFVLASEALPGAWSTPLELPVEAAGHLLVDEAGRLVVPAMGGDLLVVSDLGDRGQYRQIGSGWVDASSLVLLADGWLVQASGQRLQAGRVVGQGDQASLEGAWSHSFGNEIVGAPLADLEGNVLVVDGAGRLVRLISGAPGPARAGWPTFAGSTTLGGVEIGGSSAGAEE